MKCLLIENLAILVCAAAGFFSGIRYLGSRKALYAGMIAHALFNTLIQSEYRLAAYVVVLAMYMPEPLKMGKTVLSRKRAAQA